MEKMDLMVKTETLELLEIKESLDPRENLVTIHIIHYLCVLPVIPDSSSVYLIRMIGSPIYSVQKR